MAKINVSMIVDTLTGAADLTVTHKGKVESVSVAGVINLKVASFGQLAVMLQRLSDVAEANERRNRYANDRTSQGNRSDTEGNGLGDLDRCGQRG